ncbi:diacylglycerol kinase zeta-like isoform X2 [Rhopilema esculentum]|uniref:diacylglycerol kinase zeta-like isoform X2 n=1 Tax=Rhopilema esculentum TaxID=499914 RepID=UPI0031CF5504
MLIKMSSKTMPKMRLPIPLRKAMSVPHSDTPSHVEGRAENWFQNARKQVFPDKVDWSTSAVNGGHIWLDADASGCHIQDCKKSGNRKKCASCKVLVHEKCIEQLERINSCKCRPTFVEGSAATLKLPFPLHHVAHRRKQDGKCDTCGKYFQSMLSFQSAKDMIAVNCSWCKKAVHNKPECSKDMYMDEKCTLGMHHRLIVPPSWIVKLPPRKYSTTMPGKQRRATRRRSSRERRAFVIKPIPGSEDKIPIIVFVNPKSGGNQGTKIMEKFQWLLNPRQVFDLMSDGGPRFGLELYRKVPNLRILVCGGDGSVGWVLSEIDRLKMNPTPPVAILPLGTGNDLSRFLGWGGGYTDEPLSRILTQIESGVVEKLDRWNLDVRSIQRSPDEADTGEEAQSKLPLNVMNNYFSLGADADVCLEFHESREANPDKFTSRFRNLVFYGKAGGRQVLQSKFKDLHKGIDQLICDGRDLTERIHELKPVCILFLNISKYSAGTSPWGHPTGGDFLPQSCDDGYIEVIGFTSTSMVATQCGGHGVRIDQCSQAMLYTNKSITMQVDGEPCRLKPSRIHLKQRNKSNMIFKKKHQRFYNSPQESQVVSSKKLNLRINYLTFVQYEKLVRYDIEELKSVADPIWTLSLVDLESPLDELRQYIENLRQSQEEIKSKLSDQWCFLDATWPTRIYRIDEAQENLMLVGDVVEDGIHVLDLSRKEGSFTDSFSVSSTLKNASGWRESSTIDYHDRPSPMRRISSPTLYEFHNAKDTVSTTRVLWESHPEDSDDDFTESSEGEPEIDENDEPTTEKRGENGENEEDTELSSRECSPRPMPSSPVSKHNGLANGIDNIARLDTEEKKQLLLAAAKKGNLQTFVALHQADASLLWCDNRGYTVLHLAAKHGHKEIVKHIIANVSKCALDLVDDEKCQTPLHKAASRQRRTICRMLVNAGASLTRKDHVGNTPRLLALKAKDSDLAKFLENQERLQIIASDDHETAV